MFFTRAGLEQATAEVIARHRATRFLGAARVGDLCCGIGGDLLALADQREVIAVDRDPLRLRMAMLNAQVYTVIDAGEGDHAAPSDVKHDRVDSPGRKRNGATRVRRTSDPTPRGKA
jgi:methylase of polypeptide subunit release factors